MGIVSGRGGRDLVEGGERMRRQSREPFDSKTLPFYARPWASFWYLYGAILITPDLFRYLRTWGPNVDANETTRRFWRWFLEQGRARKNKAFRWHSRRLYKKWIKEIAEEYK